MGSCCNLLNTNIYKVCTSQSLIIIAALSFSNRHYCYFYRFRCYCCFQWFFGHHIDVYYFLLCFFNVFGFFFCPRHYKKTAVTWLYFHDCVDSDVPIAVTVRQRDRARQLDDLSKKVIGVRRYPRKKIGLEFIEFIRTECVSSMLFASVIGSKDVASTVYSHQD